MKAFLLSLLLLGASACSKPAAEPAPDCTDPTINPALVCCGTDYEPVCGCDGVTYTNACMALANRISKTTPGPCPGNSK